MDDLELVLWLVVQMEFLRLTIPLRTRKSLRSTTVKCKTAKTLRLVNMRMYELISRNIHYAYVNKYNQTIKHLPVLPGKNNPYFNEYMNRVRHITHNNLTSYSFSDYLTYGIPSFTLEYKVYNGMVRYSDDTITWYNKAWRNLTYTWYSFLFHIYYMKMVMIGPIISQMVFLYVSQINVMGKFMLWCATFWLLLCLDCNRFYVPSCGKIHKRCQFVSYLRDVSHTCVAN